MMTEYVQHVAYTNASFVFDIEVVFGVSTGATTMVGGSSTAKAKNSDGTIATGTTSILDATHIRATFASGQLKEGITNFQVKVTPLGHQELMVYDDDHPVRVGY